MVWFPASEFIGLQVTTVSSDSGWPKHRTNTWNYRIDGRPLRDAFRAVLIKTKNVLFEYSQTGECGAGSVESAESVEKRHLETMKSKRLTCYLQNIHQLLTNRQYDFSITFATN